MNARSQILPYGAVGLVNTLITFICVLSLTHMGLNPYLANAVGYAAGLTNSYLMNGKYTFKSGGSVYRFVLSFGACYFANIAVVYFLVNTIQINSLGAQLTGMITYNVLFFVCMKLWIYKNGNA